MLILHHILYFIYSITNYAGTLLCHFTFITGKCLSLMFLKVTPPFKPQITHFAVSAIFKENNLSFYLTKRSSESTANNKYILVFYPCENYVRSSKYCVVSVRPDQTTFEKSHPENQTDLSLVLRLKSLVNYPC